MGEGALFLTTSKNLNQTRCSPTGESENTQNKYKMKTSVGQYWRERGQRERGGQPYFAFTCSCQ